MTEDPLALDAETMRRLGYRAVDMLVDRLSDQSIPPLRRASPGEMAERLHGPPPDEPESFDEILRRSADVTALVAERIVREALTGLALRRRSSGE